MTVNIELKIDIGQINEIKQSLKNPSFAKVGILSGTNAREPDKEDSSTKDNLTNVEIGIKQEFGSLSENIPMRSFLRMPLNKKSKEIASKAGKAILAKEIAEGMGLDGAAARVGVAGEAAVQQAFASRGFGQWQANAPFTIAMKGSDAPLIDTSQLKTAVVSEVVRR